jgi:hypothetical protein
MEDTMRFSLFLFFAFENHAALGAGGLGNGRIRSRYHPPPFISFHGKDGV